ncbi:hypothetical protein OH776_39560 [Streptomyces sp. NBC_01578]
MPTAARLPTADALGEICFAAISDPMAISAAPMNLAILRSPNLSTSGEKIGLEVTNGRMFSTS